MREKALNYPKLKLYSNILYHAFKDSGFHLPTAFYRRGRLGRNSIYFVNMKYMSEHDVMTALLHEEAHWAQNLYLTRRECKKNNKAYARSIQMGQAPFLEFINPFEGGYNMSDWEAKYGKKAYIPIGGLGYNDLSQ